MCVFYCFIIMRIMSNKQRQCDSAVSTKTSGCRILVSIHRDIMCNSQFFCWKYLLLNLIQKLWNISLVFCFLSRFFFVFMFTRKSSKYRANGRANVDYLYFVEVATCLVYIYKYKSTFMVSNYVNKFPLKKSCSASFIAHNFLNICSVKL